MKPWWTFAKSKTEMFSHLTVSFWTLLLEKHNRSETVVFYNNSPFTAVCRTSCWEMPRVTLWADNFVVHKTWNQKRLWLDPFVTYTSMDGSVRYVHIQHLPAARFFSFSPASELCCFIWRTLNPPRSSQMSSFWSAPWHFPISLLFLEKYTLSSALRGSIC